MINPQKKTLCPIPFPLAHQLLVASSSSNCLLNRRHPFYLCSLGWCSLSLFPTFMGTDGPCSDLEWFLESRPNTGNYWSKTNHGESHLEEQEGLDGNSENRVSSRATFSSLSFPSFSPSLTIVFRWYSLCPQTRRVKALLCLGHPWLKHQHTSNSLLPFPLSRSLYPCFLSFFFILFLHVTLFFFASFFFTFSVSVPPVLRPRPCLV